MKNIRLLVAFAFAALSAASCEIAKSENPLSPSIAGPIPGVEISAPRPLEPAGGQPIPSNQQPLTLLLENAASNGLRPLSYTFEVATDADFTNKVYARDGIGPGEEGRTALRLPDPLGAGRSYYWRAKADDGANTGPFSPPAVFTIYTPVGFDKPTPLSPINNQKTSTLRPTFKFLNAPYVGSPDAVAYTLQVATGDSFSKIIAVWQFPEQPNQTSFSAPVDLPGSSQLFWRVRASDSPAIGPWSNTQVFSTPAPVSTAPPSAPGPVGGSCASAGSPLAIIQCRRAQYAGQMSTSQIVAFLKGIAQDFTKSGAVAGGPFGLLRKTSGSQCNGYSCDIICAGQGQNQSQWDVLQDAEGVQNPVWGNSPHRYPDIRIDTCDIQ